MPPRSSRRRPRPWGDGALDPDRLVSGGPRAAETAAAQAGLSREEPLCRRSAAAAAAAAAERAGSGDENAALYLIF